jgi:nucleoside-diphosphate-sugar epimerase
MRIVVTGANGFIGQAVVTAFSKRGHHVVACVRDNGSKGITELNAIADVASIGPLEQFDDARDDFLRGADAVIHAANWAGTSTREITPAYVTKVNVAATRRLAEMANRCGVTHFVYLSSTKALGNYTTTTPFSEKTSPAPKDSYGKSKLNAERALDDLLPLGVTIIRPPPVYGPGMKGGLLSLFKLAQCSLPMPLKTIYNQRDFLSLPSLTSLIVHCVETRGSSSHLGISPRILLGCDGEPMSSGDLYLSIAQALGVSVKLVPFPPILLKSIAMATGYTTHAESLLSSLRIDDTYTKAQLGWQPVCTMQEALHQTAEWFHRNG